VNDKFYRNDVTIKNLKDEAWDSARYMRTFDPDNTQFRGGVYVTDNTVTYTIAEDGKAVVKAETFDDSDSLYLAFGTRAPIFFYSKDPAAVASVFGFSNTNPYVNEAYENPTTKGVVQRADSAITITWDAGPLAPGESKGFSYYTSLDERDFDDVQEDIVIDDIEDDIDSIQDMDDVKDVRDKIDDEDSLAQDSKKEYKTILVDIVCDGYGDKDVKIRDADDIAVMNEIIDECGKNDDQKDDARIGLLLKAVEDLAEKGGLTLEEKNALQQVVDSIRNTTKKDDAQNQLNHAPKMGESTGGSGGGRKKRSQAQPDNTDGAEVLVNGKAENAGTAATIR
jgi:hypothetical protein